MTQILPCDIISIQDRHGHVKQYKVKEGIYFIRTAKAKKIDCYD